MTRVLTLAGLMAAAVASAELKNGTAFGLADAPDEIVVERRAGEPVRFTLEENVTTGYLWTYESNTNECETVVEHRSASTDRCGASGRADVTVTSRIYTPARVEFAYRRPWETNAVPVKTIRLIVYTVGEAKDPLYPRNAVNRLLAEECARRGIELTDWHLHIRGGMTVEMAAARTRDFVVRSSAMENHGREWEIFDNAKLRAFAARARKADPAMPVGVQVNDRDWFRQIDAETRAQFDYVLADTMIMGTLPSGRANRLWMVNEIPDPEAWMTNYFAHVMRVLEEPISIYANATYLPTPIAAEYDRLWTDERMMKVVETCIRRGIAIEIQAESPFPRPRFLRLAKAHGAKFSFGTNNFDPGPKDLSRWLEAITWLNLDSNDVWQVTKPVEKKPAAAERKEGRPAAAERKPSAKKTVRKPKPLAIEPAALLELLPLALEAVPIVARANEREAAHRAELGRKGLAEVPPSASGRHVIETAGLPAFLFDDWGEIYVDRRFVTEEEMKTVKAIEAWIAKWFPAETPRRKEPRAAAGKGGLPVFRGFEDARYQAHDELIVRLVNEFNTNKVEGCGGTCEQATKIADLAAALVKSQMIEEAGGNGPRSKAAWKVDPLQVNVPGDWGAEKELVGLAKPARRNEGTLEQNVRAAIRYLSRKGFSTSARPARERPKGFFDGWPTAVRRYNGRRDRTDTDRYYSEEYADKILRRAANPDVFVPIEIRLAPVESSQPPGKMIEYQEP